jgi:hypothetical protein
MPPNGDNRLGHLFGFARGGIVGASKPRGVFRELKIVPKFFLDNNNAGVMTPMYEPPYSSGGGNSTDLDREIAAFVESLHLENVLLPDTDDFELAMHRLEARKLLVWGQLDPFVRYCLAPILGGKPLPAADLEEALKQATDEYVLKGMRLVFRRTKEGKSVGLAEVAKEVFNPKSNEHGDFRERLREKVLYRMAEIGLWSFTEETGISNKGTPFHAGFKIVAGPVLLAFNRHIYMPWAIRHAEIECELLKNRGE